MKFSWTVQDGGCLFFEESLRSVVSNRF